MTISLLKFPVDTKLNELFNVLMYHGSDKYVAFSGNVRVCKRISRRFPTYSNIFKLATLNARVFLYEIRTYFGQHLTGSK